MALDAMDAVFDLDDTTTEEGITGQTDTARPFGEMVNESGPMKDLMKKFIHLMLESSNTGVLKLPFCVEVCTMRDMMDTLGNVTHSLANLRHALSTLEVCVMVMTCAVTIFALIIMCLVVFYVRKYIDIPGSIKSSASTTSMAVTIPSTAGTDSGLTMRSQPSPPPSRQAEYRVRTPTHISWLAVGKEGPPGRRIDLRVPTPTPQEYPVEDQLVPAVPSRPHSVDAAQMAAHNTTTLTRKPSWPTLGVRVNPLEEDLEERDEKI